MVSELSVAERFILWTQGESTVDALVLIGSQARDRGNLGSADTYSDWDFQMVVSRPSLFADRNWVTKAGLPEPLAYAVRLGRLGRVGKVTVIFRKAALDLVLLPSFQLRVAGWLMRLGLLPNSKGVRNALRELSLVLGPGYRLLKGGKNWAVFFQRIVAEIAPLRLDDESVLAIAEGYACDYISTRAKITRGELLAAQRWLHMQLAETNFRLLHELRLREGRQSFHDARRIELLHDTKWQAAVAIQAVPEIRSLERAVEASAQTCRDLVAALVGSRWRWPFDLPSSLRTE